MFLGSDNYKHFNNSFIKKCSACGDTSLRFLGMRGGWYFQPVWLCGQGHFVNPYYDPSAPSDPYVIYDTESMGDFGCCDANHKCEIPSKIAVNFNGILGATGYRNPEKHVLFPPCKYFGSAKPTYDNPILDESGQIPYDWPKYSWYADCGCVQAGGGCMGGAFNRPYCTPGVDENCFYTPCTQQSHISNTCGLDYYKAPYKFWGALGLFGSLSNPSNNKRNCAGAPPDCTDVSEGGIGCNYNTGYMTSIPNSPCNGSIQLLPCHNCGTLKCSEEDAKYRLPCTAPTNLFIYTKPGYENLRGLKSLIYGIDHEIVFSMLYGDGPTQQADFVCYFQNFEVKIRGQYNDGNILPCYPSGYDISIPGTYLEIDDGEEIKNFEQPICLRSTSQMGNINTEDICDQTIILDRVSPNPGIIWEENDRPAIPNKSDQAYIVQSADINEMGSMVEPELVAIIISESGTGGQVAFQTWPVSFDTDELVDSINNTDNLINGFCKQKVRMKARGYGVMYPFFDDPIWHQENNLAIDLNESNNLTLTGSPPYTFPIFLPGKNYKIGDKIHFKFWQTLNDPPQYDPAAGETYREVVMATATITEVDANGGIRWYEFDGEPISGDCPCTRDKYCGGLSRACYPDTHPKTDECPGYFGITGCTFDGDVNVLIEQYGCNPPAGTFGIYSNGPDCYPLKHTWELGGYYGISSCSGLVEDGIPAYFDGEYGIPAKAPKYSYAWLPEPDCFLNNDPLFLEYLINNDGSWRKGAKDEFPSCSPLVKVYEDYITQNYEVALRWPDMKYTGLPACRKTNSGIDVDTLFVAYSGGDGSVPSGTSTRTLDNYCRVYGFYQQKQYDCDISYKGQFILRSQNLSLAGGVSCDPIFGDIQINYSRKEIKTDITIAAPTNQDFILPEQLPIPESGMVSASFPFQQGSSLDWQRLTPNNNYPDPRNNCELNFSLGYENAFFDCDTRCEWQDDGQGWGSWSCSSGNYKEYLDTFNNRMAFRTNFRQSCGYPWESTCQTKGSAEYSSPLPECYVQDNEIICPEINDIAKDNCKPFCMLDNTSAVVSISGIIPSDGCSNGTLLIGGQVSACISDNGASISYTSKIPLIDVPATSTCADQGENDAILVFCFGLPSISLESVNSAINSYLAIWSSRYSQLGLDIPATNAFFPSASYPYDQNLEMFYSMLFAVEGVAKIKIDYSVCDAINVILADGQRCPYFSEYLYSLNGEAINLFDNQAGAIESIVVLNPGSGYAFEVEERYAPESILNTNEINISISSIPKNKKRKAETWTLSDYEFSHTGSGYLIGDTIPILFNDSDAIRDGIQYISNPTLEVTDVDNNGKILETKIINSGEYYKWIKTGQHRAYPITITVNNYWEHANGIQSLGRHASLRAVVGTDPTKDTYGRIIDVIVDQGGVEYMPNGKYWVIDTSVNGLQIDHLVDPCKYDMDALDPEILVDFNTHARGYRYVAPPLSMNGGNVLKWSDKALSWQTVMSTDRCPSGLMSRDYRMALTESITLMPASCSSSECDIVSASYNAYAYPEGPPLPDTYTVCDRYTAFYAHRFPVENMDNPQLIGSPDVTSASLLVSCGCDIRSSGVPCVAIGDNQIAFNHGGNANPNDTCSVSNGTEYTIVGDWYPNNLNIPAHVHRIYKMGGQDITMTVNLIKEE